MVMYNPLARFREFILASDHLITISAVIIVIITIAVALTVSVPQQQAQTTSLQYGRAYQTCSGTACGYSFCDNTGITPYTGTYPQDCTYHSWVCSGTSCGTQYANHYWSNSCDKTYAQRLATGAGASVPPRCVPPVPTNPNCATNSTGYTLTWNSIPHTTYNIYNGGTLLASSATNSYRSTNLNITSYTVKSYGGGRESATGLPKTCTPPIPSCSGGLTANPNNLFVGDKSNLSLTGCINATTYKWTSTCGALPSASTSTPTTTWTAPTNGATSCTVTGSACNANGVCNSPPYSKPITVNLHNCNANPQLSACVTTTSNTCSANNGTQTVKYTTYNGSAKCTPVSKTQTCTILNCNIGSTCISSKCVAPTPTPKPSIGPTPTPRPSGTPAPTPTPVPGHTMLAFTIGMDAIGSTGDNTNPTNLSSSNKTPKHTIRNLAVQIFNSNNSQVFAQIGSINYNSTSGVFTGTVDLGTNFANGNYIVKVEADGHLRKLIPGIQNISSALHQPLQISRVNLVTGDVDSNNVLNINDYNILLSCITDVDIANIDNHALCNKNANYIKLSDLEDNGVINKFDYNLFLREYSVQSGD